MMSYFHCCRGSPPLNTNDDIKKSPAQDGDTIKGDLEQLKGDRSFILWSTMMMSYFHCCRGSPPLNTNDDIKKSPAQDGDTIKGDLEQLKGDSVRSDSLSVRQRVDGACQLLFRGLHS